MKVSNIIRYLQTVFFILTGISCQDEEFKPVFTAISASWEHSPPWRKRPACAIQKGRELKEKIIEMIFEGNALLSPQSPPRNAAACGHERRVNKVQR